MNRLGSLGNYTRRLVIVGGVLDFGGSLRSNSFEYIGRGRMRGFISSSVSRNTIVFSFRGDVAAVGRTFRVG